MCLNSIRNISFICLNYITNVSFICLNFLYLSYCCHHLHFYTEINKSSFTVLATKHWTLKRYIYPQFGVGNTILSVCLCMRAHFAWSISSKTAATVKYLRRSHWPRETLWEARLLFSLWDKYINISVYRNDSFVGIDYKYALQQKQKSLCKP